MLHLRFTALSDRVDTLEQELLAECALLTSSPASLAIRAVVGPLVDVGLLGRAKKYVMLVLVSLGEALEDSPGRGMISKSP